MDEIHFTAETKITHKKKQFDRQTHSQTLTDKDRRETRVLDSMCWLSTVSRSETVFCCSQLRQLPRSSAR